MATWSGDLRDAVATTRARLAYGTSVLELLNHPGHPDQKSHGRRGGDWREDYDRAAGEVKKTATTRAVSSEALGGGWSASTTVSEYESGAKLVRKDLPNHDLIRAPQKQVDAEVLGSMVANAAGAHAPVAVETGKHQVTMPYVEGRTGAEAFGRSFMPPQEVQDSDSGRLVGLTDMLISNPDRNNGNWLVDNAGKVIPIDHGLAFRSSVSIGSPFVRAFANPALDNWASEIDMSPRDMAVIRGRLESLQPEFSARGRADWFSDMMGRFTEIESRSTGTRDRLS